MPTNGNRRLFVARTIAVDLGLLAWRWKWVVIWSATIYSTLTLARDIVNWLRKNELFWTLQASIVVVSTAILGYCIHYMVFQRRVRTWRPYLKLGFVLFVYGQIIDYLAGVPIERIHLLEYGLLGLLVYRAFSDDVRGWRRAGYTVITVTIIGLVDELIQGLLPTRYCDMRDVFVNGLAGLLLFTTVGITVPELLTRGKGGGTEPARRKERGGAWKRILARDVAALLCVGAFVGCLQHIHDLDVGPEDFLGTWERWGLCDIPERIHFDGKGSFLWENDLGSIVTGDYRIDGNILDGPIIKFLFVDSCDERTCFWHEGMHLYAHVFHTPKYFAYRWAFERPFVRISTP